MENRDGAAIRHSTARLLASAAKTKILILLSDGKPLDCGCRQYSDRYAQADTKKALQEARIKGVFPFCITIDEQGGEYLADMYGERDFLVLDRVEKLPSVLPQMYQRFTR